MKGWTAQDTPDQTGKVVVITGANSGVGYESALALARKGARVVMACRNIEKGEEARRLILQAVPGADVDVMLLDLSDLASVRAFADQFNARYERLDILMNNAGIMMPPYAATSDGFESQFGTNHLGHFALTGLLLPKILATPNSRIVTVSSGLYAGGRINFADLQGAQEYNRRNAYAQSKLANVLFALELQRRLEVAGAQTISVVIHPGYTATNLQRHGANRIEQAMLRAANKTIAMRAAEGAKYQLYAATAADVKGGGFYGPRYAMRGAIAALPVNQFGRDTAVATQLWQASEQLTGVRYEALQASVPT